MADTKVPATLQAAKDRGLEPVNEKEETEAESEEGVHIDAEINGICYIGPCNWGRRKLCYLTSSGCNNCFWDTSGCG